MEEGIAVFLHVVLFLSISCLLYDGVDGLFLRGGVRVCP